MHKWAIVKQPMGRPLPRPSHADEDQALSLSLSLSLFSLSLSLCLSSLSLSLSSLFSRSPLEYGCPVAAELDRLALRRLEAGSVGNETACHGCLPFVSKKARGEAGLEQKYSRQFSNLRQKKELKKNPSLQPLRTPPSTPAPRSSPTSYPPPHLARVADTPAPRSPRGPPSWAAWNTGLRSQPRSKP